MGRPPRARCLVSVSLQVSSWVAVRSAPPRVHSRSKYARQAAMLARSAVTAPNSWVLSSAAPVRLADLTTARLAPNRYSLACRPRMPLTRPPAARTRRSAAMSLTRGKVVEVIAGDDLDGLGAQRQQARPRVETSYH